MRQVVRAIVVITRDCHASRSGLMEPDDRIAQRRRQNDALSNYRIFPRPGPKLYTAVIWYAFGLYVLFVARAPFTPSPEDEQKYSDLMQAAVWSPEMKDAQDEYFAAERRLNEVHVFGWRWREPYSQLVPPRQAELDQKRAKLNVALKERDALKSEAKAAVGLWSQYGVDEVRDRWWEAYQAGKDFAKRMTWWDVMFGIGGRGNRDEELLGTLLRWLGQIMMNFTVGLISALFSFCFALVSVIWEYKASYLSGLVFFLVAMTGASAMVATFVGGMYATAAGGVYMAIKTAQNQQRLEGGRRRAAPQYVRNNRYEHYD